MDFGVDLIDGAIFTAVGVGCVSCFGVAFVVGFDADCERPNVGVTGGSTGDACFPASRLLLTTVGVWSDAVVAGTGSVIGSKETGSEAVAGVAGDSVPPVADLPAMRLLLTTATGGVSVEAVPDVDAKTAVVAALASVFFGMSTLTNVGMTGFLLGSSNFFLGDRERRLWVTARMTLFWGDLLDSESLLS